VQGDLLLYAVVGVFVVICGIGLINAVIKNPKTILPVLVVIVVVIGWFMLAKWIDTVPMSKYIGPY